MAFAKVSPLYKDRQEKNEIIKKYVQSIREKGEKYSNARTHVSTQSSKYKNAYPNKPFFDKLIKASRSFFPFIVWEWLISGHFIGFPMNGKFRRGPVIHLVCVVYALNKSHITKANAAKHSNRFIIWTRST